MKKHEILAKLALKPANWGPFDPIISIIMNLSHNWGELNYFSVEFS